MTPPIAFPDDVTELPAGGHMPLVGFGTWRLAGAEAVVACGLALEAGYRHLDTATMYANEREVGQALRQSGLPRHSVFLTTKVAPDDAGRASEVLTESLDQLGVEQIDLWLIHWPPADSTQLWRDVVLAKQQGLVKDVGVSNFSLAELDDLADATGVMPAVNQIPWSPLLFDRALLDGHRDRAVVLEGYSALKHGILDHPVIVEIAQQLGRTPAQVIVRWHLQHRIVVIPKSADPERISANADVTQFELSHQQMAALDALGNG